VRRLSSRPSSTADGRDDRYIEAHKDPYGVEPICRVLEIAPSTYYAALSRPPCSRCSGVAAAGRPGILGAGKEQAAQLALGNGAAAGQALPTEGGQVDSAGVLLGGQVPQPPAFLQDAAEGDKHPVLGGQRTSSRSPGPARPGPGA
jgi:hypothetical protein